MKRKLILIWLLAITKLCTAQTTPSSADIYKGLKKLNVLGSVLYIAAHPDDENTRLLTFLAKDRMFRTGYLSLTRGDGGQNLIGNEQGVALGLIRTQELLAARRIDGAEQFFTRAFDFGFSKNPEETFTKWDKEKILGDVVWVIRKFQPDVIITRFPTTGEGGHGHHTASAILATEAFKAAADPKRFPEQLKYVQPWQAKRILWNTFNFGGNNTQRPDQFTLDVGGFDPVSGKSYGEIAAESRSQHKSQGFGAARTRGEAIEYFATLNGTRPDKDLMDEINVNWNRLNGGETIAPLVQSAIQNFDFIQPNKSIGQLTGIYNALKNLPKSNWQTQKLEEVKQLILWSSGLWLDAFTNIQNAVQGDSVRINFTLNNRSGADIKLKRIQVNGFDSVLNTSLKTNQNLIINKSVFVPFDKPISQPFWLKEKMEVGQYVVNDLLLIGQPDNTPSYVTRFELEIDGTLFTFEKPVQYKIADPVKGELYEPLFVVPGVTVSAAPDVLIYRKGEKERKEALLQLNANKKIYPTVANVELRSANFSLSRKDSTFSLEKGASRAYTFNINNTASANRDSINLQGFAYYTNSPQLIDAHLSSTTIQYDHIPTIKYFFSDDIKLLNINLKTKGNKIGYIVGAGDKVPEALEQMGFEVTLLTDNELSRNHLKKYDAIIAGVRAYNTNEWLNSHYENLMNYVKEGGNLIVQYNTSNQIGPVRAKIGPYNFNITRNRVTDETAPVQFLKPTHKVLNYPNKITADDFKGWVQERSIYHASEWDKNFESILRIGDPGETPDDGSLIITKYGEGYFTYTGLVFFRELPAGVPGSFRLLANLIALNKNK
ncbi:PIG-L family deacetylase [Chitinophagaceae bacterium LB-8]|uniref:PIG-L family deacetylase n=1 Tax=Paraflavisolibacter caeni TaxID=2982496 RepID=A0A9X2Y0Q5_9BACT|nr:PIG-L family deacetylase [Paraflavisolibacter caeni]MCU7552511.1 PIG-L family deacetylase [Paraflavisolibacter caeni]